MVRHKAELLARYWLIYFYTMHLTHGLPGICAACGSAATLTTQWFIAEAWRKRNIRCKRLASAFGSADLNYILRKRELCTAKTSIGRVISLTCNLHFSAIPFDLVKRWISMEESM